MKKIILLIATLTLSGCYFGGGPVVIHKTTPTKTVVVEETVYHSTPSHASTTVVEEVVVYEETYYCDYYGSMPFYADPDQCFYYPTHTECDWYVGWGCYEVWEWDDYSCEWYYAFDYCT